MMIEISKEEATEILTDIFFAVVNNGLELGQGNIPVGIKIKEDDE